MGLRRTFRRLWQDLDGTGVFTPEIPLDLAIAAGPLAQVLPGTIQHDVVNSAGPVGVNTVLLNLALNRGWYYFAATACLSPRAAGDAEILIEVALVSPDAARRWSEWSILGANQSYHLRAPWAIYVDVSPQGSWSWQVILRTAIVLGTTINASALAYRLYREDPSAAGTALPT